MKTNHWIFNAAYATEEISRDAQSVKMSISSVEPSLTFAKNDPYISMDRIHEEFKFLYYGKILEVDTPKHIPLTDEEIAENKILALRGAPRIRSKYIHDVFLKIDDYLVQQAPLRDIAFSLKSVHRYINPEKQFQQQYRTLFDKDFETILRGWIYVARTAFGKIANSLPRENKLEFTLLAMDKFRTIDFKEVDFIAGLDFLFEYVHENIINQGILLVATDELLQENFSHTVAVDEVSLLETGAIVPNRISGQAELFRNLIEIDQKSTFITQIKRGIEENGGTERRFRDLFKNTTWPIDLTV